MSIDYCSFFGIVSTPLVRHGVDEKLRNGQHVAAQVYQEMILQISRDYPGLPDVRALTSSQIVFFYDGLRNELKNIASSK